MLQAMFSGVSGLQVHQTKLDVIGNNIANVNTVGFKAGRVTFQDQISQTLRSSASPGASVGGTNPAQVGLGVVLGAVDTIQSQGNLQTTGKSTDLAIQGNGFFLVSSGSDTYYTRDGSFDLDSDGVLVNPANGLKLLGFNADKNGGIDSTQPITSNSVLSIPIGTKSSVQQTSTTTFAGNLDASSAIYSTKSTFDGNVKTDPTNITTTAYDSNGTAHSINLILSGKTTAAGTDTFTAAVNVDGVAIPGSYHLDFDSTTHVLQGTSVLPATVTLTGASGSANISIALAAAPTLTDDSSAAGSLAGTTDGTAGVPAQWKTSVNVFDSLGLKHSIVYTFNRVPVSGAVTVPSNAQAQWNWTATENGGVVADSTTGTNQPLFFDGNGSLINDKALQNITITPTNKALPFTIKLDFSTLTFKGSNSSSATANGSNVQVSGQDGFPLGVLQSFNITQAGLITGIFSNGQQSVLGQVATAAFSNPAGLSKQGENLYKESSNSGLAQTGKPDSNGRGKINTGFVEMSNVDLSTEFTNLIVTQRGFQANTRIITVVDDLLQDVINLKR